jgi:ribosomal protein S18 acetylase RimI-like enzyme
MIRIRRAQREDAPALFEIQSAVTKVPGRLVLRPHEVHKETIEAKVLSLSADSAGVYLVAEQEATVIGFGSLQRYAFEAIAHIVELSLAVHPSAHRRGVGRALMNELILWAKTQASVEKIELRVRATNEPAITLYRSLGFVEEGRFVRRIKLTSGTYLDDVAMALWVGT